MSRTLFVACGWLTTLGWASDAHAFCRATTCDPSDPSQACEIVDSCVVSGEPLYWSSDCIKVGVQAAGSRLHGVGFESLMEVTSQAFQAWQAAECAGGTPSIHVQIVGPIACNKAEYNPGAGNVSLVTFRDDDWPYMGAVDAIGRTTIRFDTETGEIWDSDIEINGTLGPITTDGSGSAFDLASILTHEAGHALGLAHSTMFGATMIAGHSGRDVELRTLEFDDLAGICTMYPPERELASTSCEPRGGFSAECGGYISKPPPDPVEPMLASEEDGGCCLVASAVHPQAGTVSWLMIIAFELSRRRARGRHAC